MKKIFLGLVLLCFQHFSFCQKKDCKALLAEYVSMINTIDIREGKMIEFAFTMNVTLKKEIASGANSNKMFYRGKIGKGIYVVESPMVSVFADMQDTYTVLPKARMIQIDKTPNAGLNQSVYDDFKTQILNMQQLVMEGESVCSVKNEEGNRFQVLTYRANDEVKEQFQISEIVFYFDEKEKLKMYKLQYANHPALLTQVMHYNKFFTEVDKPADFSASRYLRESNITKDQINQFQIVDNR